MTAQRRRQFGRRATALLASLGLVAVLVTAQGTGSTEASWRDGEYARATFSAGTLGTPRSNGCTPSGLTFTPRWLAPSAGVSPSSYQYRLTWKPLIGSEQLVRDWTSTALVTQFTYAVPTTILAAGTYTFRVRAVAGTWISGTRTGTATVISVLGAISLGGCSWS